MKNKRKKIVWLDINSSYSHSSLALPAIEAQHPNCDSMEWDKVSGTINSVISSIIGELLEKRPDIIAYTAWLFTHEIILKILSRYKTIEPSVIIIGGGPEYLGNNEDFLRHHPYINYVVRGEGEEVFYQWLKGETNVKGICCIDKGIYHDGGLAKVENYDQLRFPEESRFFDWSKPFVQIESTRGCFNSCAFCVSGADKPVRQLSIETLRKKLETARQNGIHDIRLLDRTFNGMGTRAIEMLSLFEEYHGILRFHLEVHPALFSAKIREKMMTMPEGLLHIEAGVQSLSQKVLDATARFGKVDDVIDGLKFLCSLKKFEVHSDLIAGLPHYTLTMLYDDIRTLADIGCDEIQLELLKLLPGTAMRNNSTIHYSPLPPYEVMENDSVSFAELQEARRLSRMLDLYYNCKTWQKSTRKLIHQESDFLHQFTSFLTDTDMIDTPMSQERRGTILYDYCKEHYPQNLGSVAVDWIMGGLSLKRGAASGVKSYNGAMKPEFGENSRIYFLEMSDSTIWFSYDRALSHSEPIYLEVISKLE